MPSTKLVLLKSHKSTCVRYRKKRSFVWFRLNDSQLKTMASSSQELIKAAQAEYSRKDYEAALNSCKKALQLDKNCFHAYMIAGAVAVNFKHDFPRALDAYQRALKTAPEAKKSRPRMALLQTATDYSSQLSNEIIAKRNAQQSPASKADKAVSSPTLKTKQNKAKKPDTDAQVSTNAVDSDSQLSELMDNFDKLMSLCESITESMGIDTMDVCKFNAALFSIASQVDQAYKSKELKARTDVFRMISTDRPSSMEEFNALIALIRAFPSSNQDIESTDFSHRKQLLSKVVHYNRCIPEDIVDLLIDQDTVTLNSPEARINSLRTLSQLSRASKRPLQAILQIWDSSFEKSLISEDEAYSLAQKLVHDFPNANTSKLVKSLLALKLWRQGEEYLDHAMILTGLSANQIDFLEPSNIESSSIAVIVRSSLLWKLQYYKYIVKDIKGLLADSKGKILTTKDIMLHILYGHALAGNKKTSDACNVFNQIKHCDIHDYHMRNSFAKGLFSAFSRLYGTASSELLEEVKWFTQKYPLDALGHLELGRVLLLNSGDPAEVEACLEKSVVATEKVPQNEDELIWYDWIFVHQSLSVDKIRSRTKFYLGIHSWIAANGEDVKQLFMDSASHDPQFSSSFAFLGLFLQLSGNSKINMERAARCYRRALIANPCNFVAGSFLCHELMSNGSEAEAIEIASKASAVNPRCRWALSVLGWAKRRLRKYDESITAFQKIMRISDDHFRTEMFEEDEGLLNKLNIPKDKWLFPHIAQVWRGLGLSYLDSSRFESALSAFDEGLKFCNRERPELQELKLELSMDKAETLMRLGFMKEARLIFEDILKSDLHPGFQIFAWQGMGEAFLGCGFERWNLGEWKLGIQYFLDASELFRKAALLSRDPYHWKRSGDVSLLLLTFQRCVDLISEVEEIGSRTRGCYSRAVHAEPWHAIAYSDLGSGCILSGDENPELQSIGMRCLIYGITRHHKSSIFWRRLGATKMLSKATTMTDPYACEECLCRAMEQNEDFENAVELLAGCHVLNGLENKNAVYKCLEASLTNNPRSKMAWLLLGCIRELDNDVPAKDTYGAYLDADKNGAGPYGVLGLTRSIEKIIREIETSSSDNRAKQVYDYSREGFANALRCSKKSYICEQNLKANADSSQDNTDCESLHDILKAMHKFPFRNDIREKVISLKVDTC